MQLTGQQDPGEVAHTFTPSPWELETGESEVQSYCQPCSKFKTDLGHRRPCLKTQGSLRQLLADVLENQNFTTRLKTEMTDHSGTVTTPE